jgi:anti-sigma-K factor RskA
MSESEPIADTSPLSESDVRALIGAYVLDGVSDDERVAVQQLIGRDPSAATEAARLTSAVDAVVSVSIDGLIADDEPGPSASVWNNIVGGMASQPQVVPIDELSQRRRRSSTTVRWIAGAAAAIVLFAGGTLLATHRESWSVREAAENAIDDSSSAKGTLRNDVIAVKAVVTTEGNGFLLVDRIAAPPQGKTYQLWSLDGTQPVSLGIIGDQPTTVSFAAGSQPRSLAISIEPDGGSPQPTKPIGAMTLSYGSK